MLRLHLLKLRLQEVQRRDGVSLQKQRALQAQEQQW